MKRTVILLTITMVIVLCSFQTSWTVSAQGPFTPDFQVDCHALPATVPQVVSQDLLDQAVECNNADVELANNLEVAVYEGYNLDTSDLSEALDHNTMAFVYQLDAHQLTDKPKLNSTQRVLAYGKLLKLSHEAALSIQATMAAFRRVVGRHIV